jgi:ABC-type branched-subunit amino acid transport system ATPase component
MKLSATEEFRGLKLASAVILQSKIAAIVGRNGSGKSRFLEAIQQGKIYVEDNDIRIPQEKMLHINWQGLQPSISFGFDLVRHEEELRSAAANYESFRGRFSPDPMLSAASINQAPQQGVIHSRNGFAINAYQLALAVSRASKATGKDVNELDVHDVSDYFPAAMPLQLGSINITSAMLTYWQRLEKNSYHNFLNNTKNENLPHWSPEGFEKRFGPPPWTTFNNFLNLVLDGKYQIPSPTYANHTTYEASLIRDDGRVIEPGWLSSGEKALMWLCLSMYASETGRVTSPPRLLLLDEPDGALHPQMVQKMHKAFDVIVKSFGSTILFTTHSPTTIALFEEGTIFRASEKASPKQITKEEAISELLIGLDQISVHYTNQRQVYVESPLDAELYDTIFVHLWRWGKLSSGRNIKLSFIPAAPKLPRSLVEQLFAAHFKEIDTKTASNFFDALDGQGNCVQVLGQVESLRQQGNETVHGIIDWDYSNRASSGIHVLGIDQFYAIENALLNPLTLGLYLLKVHANNVQPQEFGLPANFDLVTLYHHSDHWQMIADSVTRKVLKTESIRLTIKCEFLMGCTLNFDSNYVHHNGHKLEEKIKDTFPFLKAFTARRPLLTEIATREIAVSQGRSLPKAFQDLFIAIQGDTIRTVESSTF